VPNTKRIFRTVSRTKCIPLREGLKGWRKSWKPVAWRGGAESPTQLLEDLAVFQVIGPTGMGVVVALAAFGGDAGMLAGL